MLFEELVVLICVFLFASGIPTMQTVGLGKFLFGMTWAPGQGLYGIFPRSSAMRLKASRSVRKNPNLPCLPA